MSHSPLTQEEGEEALQLGHLLPSQGLSAACPEGLVVKVLCTMSQKGQDSITASNCQLISLSLTPELSPAENA